MEHGTRVDNYTVEALLGEGGFGAVYRARDDTGRDVALKVANTALGEQSTKQVIWQHNEIEALFRLEHPSLVDVHDHGFLDDGRLYFAMELVGGTELDTYVREHAPLDPIQALAIIGRIAECVRYCHGQRVLHLDLKLPNVLLVDPLEPTLKVLDFGLATLVGGYEQSDGTIAGTPLYMPPEAFTASSPPDASYDTYAIGVMLFELLTGRAPFRADTVVGMYQLKLDDRRPAPSEIAPGVPPALDQLVAQLLEPNSGERLSSAAEVEARVRRLYYDTLHGRAGTSRKIATFRGAGDEQPFVGRASEVDRLRQTWERARQQGSAINVVGPAGVGKSTLVSRFLNQSNDEALVGYGRCRQVGGLVPYVPFREGLSQIISAVGRRANPAELSEALREELGEDAHRLAGVVPELSAFLAPGLEEVSGSLTQSSSGARLGGLLAGALAALASTNGLILVLEDLHWSDAGVAEALEGLLEAGLPPNTMVLATSRPEAGKPSIAGLEELAVLELSSQDNDALLDALLPEIGPAALRSIKRRVPLLEAGNPLFVTSVVRDLVESGCLTVDETGATGVDEGALRGYTAPSSVDDVIERILDRVESSVLEVLRVAALIGRKFEVGDLHALAHFTKNDVREAVADAVKLHLVTIEPGGQLLFAHDSVREQLETQLDEVAKPELHRQIADALARRRAPAGDLAHHLHQGGRIWEAAQAYVQAGLQAESMLDPRGAAAQTRLSVELLIGMQPTEQRDRLLANAVFELVRLACQIGDTERTLKLVRAAEQSIGPDSLTVNAAIHSALARLYYVRGEFATALTHAQTCLSTTASAFSGGTLNPAANELRRYRLAPANILGRALCASGKFAAAVPHLEHGCDLAKQEGELVELSHSTAMLGLSLGYMGQLDRARRHVAAGAELAEQLGDPVRKLGALFYEAVAAEYTFDYGEGVRVSTEALRFAERASLGGLYVYLSLIFAGRHQFHAGRMGRARVLLDKAAELSAQLNISMGLGWLYAFLGDVHMVLGGYDQAGGLYEKGLDASKRGAGDDLGVCYCLAGITHHAGLRGDLALAREAAEEGLLTSREAGNVRVMVDLLQRYAEALDSLGEDSSFFRQKRLECFESIGVSPVDWWPVVPPELLAHWQREHETQAQPTSREFWMSKSSVELVPPPVSADTMAFADTAAGEAVGSDAADTEIDLPAITRLLDEL